jgi:DNA-binding response OmpR family regulator
VLHVCLAGLEIILDHELLDALSLQHCVSLISDPMQLGDIELLQASDVLVLDASSIRSSLPDLLRSLRRRRPDLPIVLVDGGLTEHDKAAAFALGVVDYFPRPWPVRLLAERLEVVARARALDA